MSLEEGETNLERRLNEEGFRRCPGQNRTSRDGNCGVSAILHQLNNVQAYDAKDEYEDDPTIFRNLVVHFFVQEVKKNNFPFPEGNIKSWSNKMRKNGEFVDYYWLLGASKMLGRDIVMIPTFQTSSHEIDRIIRIQGGPETSENYPPLFLGYIEEHFYSAGHFQSIEPCREGSPITEYLMHGIKPFAAPGPASAYQQLAVSEFSTLLRNMPSNRSINQSSSMISFSRRPLGSVASDISSPVHNSTKRARESEAAEPNPAKRLKHSIFCHLCHFPVENRDRKNQCKTCQRTVHHSCNEGDGSSCGMY